MTALDQLPQRIAALAEKWNVPGVAVMVDVAGTTHSACHGITHIDHPLPIDEHTLFQVASNTKPFAATLVMALIEEGRLSLDDPVRQHLPEFTTPGNRLDNAVTVRQLLSHRVGWDGDELLVRPPAENSLAAAPAAMAEARQLVEPDSQFTYSNAGYSIAGRLIETLEGEPFSACLERRILQPLAMERSCTRADRAIFHRVAMRHLSLPGRKPIALPGGGWQRGWELGAIDEPAAGLISSAHDLLQWLRFWLGRPSRSEGRPLSDAGRATMLEEQERYNPQWGQAIGWALRYDTGARVYNHGGLTAGYCSFTLFVPELDLAGVILTNSTSGGALHSELSRWIIGQASGVSWQPPVPLAPVPDLKPYTGRYWSAFGWIEVRALDDGRSLELATERHPTQDGSWQPPPEEPLRLVLCHPHHAMIEEPEAIAGALVDFDPAPQPKCAWLRAGGRIAVREST